MLTLIEILRTQKTEHPKRNWDELEDHVRYVYDHMLTMSKVQTMVTRDVTLTGQSGQQHQVDVYYEFERAGIWHRVAIECKNRKRPLSIADISRVVVLQNDSPRLICVIVSASGYQSGADKTATNNGIIPLTLDDLPSIGAILADRLQDSTIPGKDSVGEPFWTIYDLEDGEVDGTLHMTHDSDGFYSSYMFLSKKCAEDFLEFNKMKDQCEVRGLRQHHLLAYIPTVDFCVGRFILMARNNGEFGTSSFAGIEMPRDELLQEFCLTQPEQLKERNVAPPFKHLYERKLAIEADWKR